VRLVVALAVIAVAWASAVWVHQRHVTATYCPDTAGCAAAAEKAFNSASFSSIQIITRRSHPSWEDPVGVLLALGGVAVAVGIAHR
jgi:hypothetical protein